MAVPDWLRQSRWPALAAVVAGLALGALMADGVDDTGDGVADAWVALGPDQVGRIEPGAATAIGTSPLWRSGGGPTPAEQAAVRWNLLGIVDGNPPRALVGTANAAGVARLAEGDALPDGRRITAIQEAAIVVADDAGCRTMFRLYQGASVRPETSCDTAAPASDPVD